jgi:putative ABC transport system permease protein
MHDAWSYVRSAVRGFLKAPVSASAVLLTLVLSLGASTSIFTVVNGVLLSPLPFRDSERLVAAWTKSPHGRERGDVAPADFWDFRRQAQGFTDIAAVSTTYWNLNWSTGEQNARLRAAITSSNLLSVLGVKPMLGPGFDSQHDSPTGEQAVVLSHGIWRNRLGGDPHIIGKSVVLDSKSFTVRGVLPETLRFPADDTDIWLPPSYLGKEMTLRGESFLSMVGRLRPDASFAAGRTELTGIASRLAALYPDTNTGRSVAVAPLREALVERVQTPLYLLLGAVGCMLLIACTNVSGLLLGRALGRQQEMAVRMALGAGRTSLVFQPVLESVTFALAGGGLGLLAARFATPLLLSLAPGLPHAAQIGFDGRVVAVSLFLALLSGLVVGGVPAYWSARADLRGRLAAGGRGSTFAGGASRMADALIVGQVMLAIVLLIGAGLLTKSFLHLIEIKPGFDPDHAVTMRVTLPDAPYSEIETRRAFYRRLLDEVAAMPGVEAVGATSRLPMTMEDITSNLVLEGRPLPAPQPLVGKRMISEDYFKAMRIPLLTGRAFDRSDGSIKRPTSQSSSTRLLRGATGPASLRSANESGSASTRRRVSG